MRTLAGECQIEGAVAVEVMQESPVIGGDGGDVGGRGVGEPAARLQVEVVGPVPPLRDRAVEIEVEASVVVHVAEHAAVVPTVNGHAPFGTGITPAAGGVEKQTGCAVVGRDEVEAPIGVYIGHARTHGAVGRITWGATAPRESQFLGDVGEPPAVVAEHAVRIAIHVAHHHIEITVGVEVSPHRAHAAAGVGQPDGRGDVGEHAGIVPVERVAAVAKRHEQIHIAIGVVIHPHRLSHRATVHGELRRDRRIGEYALVVAIQLEHRAATGGEPHEQVGVAVAVEVAEGGRASGTGIGDASGRCNVSEHAAIITVEPVRYAVESHEEIEIGVAIDVRRRIHQ